MKTTGTIATAIAALALTATTALAAGQARPSHGSLLVWVFLGMCALIVVAQAFPAVLMLVGMIKGLVSSKHPASDLVQK